MKHDLSALRQCQLIQDMDNPFLGKFRMLAPCNRLMTVVASDGMGWEHVSVSFRDRTPTWEEMCWIKDLFWDEEEVVIQYHPPKSKAADFHPYCLHLWKSTTISIPVPAPILVGPQGAKCWHDDE